ncbi:MAG: flavodoxin family protein [Desulfovibrio sp.]|nr:flavodoxin family protein [Desulfovibrio sp.]
MRLLVVYSSRTGNTRQVAQQALAAWKGKVDIHPVEQAPSPDGYDVVAVGYWVDKGKPDPRAAGYMAGLAGQRVAIFGTLGASPASGHAEDVRRAALDVVQGNDVLGSFLCQGRIDPELIKVMAASGHHPMTPERRANIEEAAKHPDANDLAEARRFFEQLYDIACEEKVHARHDA